jgi:hypothetical protein
LRLILAAADKCGRHVRAQRNTLKLAAFERIANDLFDSRFDNVVRSFSLEALQLVARFNERSEECCFVPPAGTSNTTHEFEASAALVSDRHAELREAMREVGGAVERINDPPMLALPRAGPALFGEDRVIKKRRFSASG